MFKLIVRTLKRVGIKMILKEIYIESYLNYYSLHFLDKYDNWCNLRIFYNETQFFVGEVNLIGKGRDLIFTDSIVNSIRLMGSYDDYLASDLNEPSKEEVDLWLQESMDNLSENLLSVDVPNNISLKEVKVFSNPSLMIFIYFTFKGVRVEPIKFFVGEKINYNSRFVDSSSIDVESISRLIKSIEEVLGYE